MPRSDVVTRSSALPVPALAAVWAAVVYALATLTLAYPILSGQFLVNPRSDQYIAGFAFRDFAAQSLRAGHGVPQWNPYMFGGLPYVAAMHGDIFYPTALLRLLMPTDTAMSLGFALHLLLAGLFTYGFLRAWGLGFSESLTAGLAYMLSGPIASYASPGHDGKLFVSALLPAALWLLVRGVRDGRNWAWGVFAITIGLAVLSPHPQLLQYMLLTSGAFALFLAFSRDAEGNQLDRKIAARRLAFATGAVVLGMAIGAVQYLPVREYVNWSPRAGGKDYTYATSYSFPFIELPNLYVPQFTGILDKYWGPNGIHLHSEYLGGSLLMLASLAFGGDRDRAFRRFWLGTAIVSFLWMLGGNTPFFALVYNIVPGTKFFRAPSTIIYVFSFSASVLVALGTRRALEGVVNKRLLIGWAVFAVVVILIAASGLGAALIRGGSTSFAQMIIAQRGYPADALPQILYEIVRRNVPDLIAGAVRSGAFLLLCCGVIIAVQRSKITARIGAAVIMLLLAADLWSIARLYWIFSAPARVLYATDPAIEYIKHDTVPGRVFVLANPDSNLKNPDPYFGTDGLGRGTGLAIHGIRSVTGYHGNELGRYQKLSEFKLVDIAPPVLVSPMFWRHENVRYLYTNKPTADSGVSLVAGPVRNSAGSTVYLYLLKNPAPYAWLAAGAVTASDEDAMHAVVDPRFDARRLVTFDSSAASIPPRPSSMPAPLTLRANTTRVVPGAASITLEAPAPEGATLVVAENYFPGWHAMVDGVARPAYRADYNLIGVPLPAGARKIELAFRDAAVETGERVTIVAALVALLALAAGIATDRRRLA